MSSSKPRRKPWAHRWATSERSARPEERARLREYLDEAQPGFWTAVVADARITAQFRGEHHEFASRLDALVQIGRLAWITDSFFAQLCYRAEVRSRVHGVPVLPRLLHHVAVMTGQVNIGPGVHLSPGVYVPHGQIVIDGLTSIGQGVVIRPFVTVGLRDGWVVGPRIEDKARLGTGAKVFGPLTVGRNARVGANAVVLRDVPANRRAVGVPARVIPGVVGGPSRD